MASLRGKLFKKLGNRTLLEEDKLRRFVLRRTEDTTGVSGTGDIAEGVCFSSGEVALKWRTTFWSCVFYLNMDTVEHIHGHGGKTRIVWIDKPTREDIVEE